MMQSRPAGKSTAPHRFRDVARNIARTAALLVVLCDARYAGAQGLCAPLNRGWWQLSATRFLQGSGAGQRASSLGIEMHFIDRRILRRIGTGYQLGIQRTKLGLRDTTVDIAVDYALDGALIRVTGDTATLGRDVSSLLTLPCTELTQGRTLADPGDRVDTIQTAIQQSVTRTRASQPVTVGSAIDTLGQQLISVTAARSVHDTSRGSMLRQLPNQRPDTVAPWALLAGEEHDRQLVRARDGLVVIRQRSRSLTGRGWVPPHPDGDTVPIRVEYASLSRVVDSTTAAAVLAFSRRGERLVSATARDTVALHYREWRGDTLIVRQVRRSGWRDELRTVWRDSALVGATLTEPGTAVQEPGPFQRQFRVRKGLLIDAGARDTMIATPTYPWAIALDGFEDALVPALLAIPVDSQPHRFSMYGIQNERGAWLNWSVNIVPRGPVRVARFYTLLQEWVGTFIFTPAGELIFANLGGVQGVTRAPAAGTRLAALLDAQRGKIRPEDLAPQPVITRP